MEFLSPEEIRKVRVKNARKFKLDELGKDILIVNPSAAAANRFAEIKAQVDEGKLKRWDLFLFMLQVMCATESGELFDEKTAHAVMEIISMEQLNLLANEFMPKKAAELPNSPANQDAA